VVKLNVPNTFRKSLKYFYLCYPSSAAPTHTGGITKATNDERLDIHQLIKKVDMRDVSPGSKITSELFTYQRNPKSPIYRLDREGQTKDGSALFRIQSGSKTFGSAAITPNHNWGTGKIRNSFINSIKKGQHFILQTSNLQKPQARVVAPKPRQPLGYRAPNKVKQIIPTNPRYTWSGLGNRIANKKLRGRN
jgi:hypothetical protein